MDSATVDMTFSFSTGHPCPSVFIKPLRDPKAFAAKVVNAFEGLVPLAKHPDELPVLVSEPIDFFSEWRFFILSQTVVGAGWYAGNPLLFPNAEIVRRAVETWGSEAPLGYAIDFGISADRRTLLVEVNEGYSLGCLGLSPHMYVQILEARWKELTQGR